jgi:hypothetical protein
MLRKQKYNTERVGNRRAQRTAPMLPPSASPLRTAGVNSGRVEGGRDEDMERSDFRCERRSGPNSLPR